MKFSTLKHKYKLIFLIISLLLYGNTLKNGYSLDDEFVTGPQNITSKGFKSIIKVFKILHVNDESGNNYEYRPIVKVTYAIESGLWGENLMLSHLVNVLLYVLCLIVLFNFLKLLFKELDEFIIFCIVLVFALLPVHSEVVASLKNRDVLLSFLFSFLAFTNVIKFLDTRKKIRLLIAPIMFALAYLSKFDVVPMLAIIPLVIAKKYKLNYKVTLTLIGALIFSYFLYRLTKGTMLDRKVIVTHRIFQFFENPLYFEYDLIDRISAGLNSLGFYAKMLIWPNKMACFYGYNTVQVYSFTSFYALLGVASAIALGYVFFTRFKKPDMLWFGVVFFSGSISMYLNAAVPAAGIVADRFMFFASVGFSIIVVYLVLKLDKPKTKISKLKDLKFSQKALSGIVFVIFAGLIINRNTEWKSKGDLFAADAKKYPESVKLSLLTTSQLIIDLNNKEKASAISDNEKLKRIRSAEILLQKAIKTDSSCGGCYNNLSYMYLTFERNPAAALPYLKLGYIRDTTKKEMICNLGIAYFRLGDIESAKKYLFLAIKHDTLKNFRVPYEVLQDLYMRTNITEGIAFFQSKLKENPNSELFNVLIGKTYFEAKDTLNSIKFYKEALKINPNNVIVADFVTKLEVKYHKSDW